MSFSDHFSQATLFYRSLTLPEQAHIAEAFTFELGKCHEQAIKERELSVLANVDAGLCEQVAGPGPARSCREPRQGPHGVPGAFAGRARTGPHHRPQDRRDRRADSDLAGIGKVRRALAKHGATVHVIGAVGGVLATGKDTETVERTFLTARSIEFDAIIVAAGTEPDGDITLVLLLQEAYRHCKTVGAWGNGAVVLEMAQIPAGSPGVLAGGSVVKAFNDNLIAAVGMHRFWDRAPLVMASAVPPAD